MGKAIPAQHPAVVLRSQFVLVRALLVAATIAVIGLSIAVVIVANDTDQAASKSGAASSVQSLRYGGFNPATGRPESAPLARPHTLPVVPAHPPISQGGGVDEGTSSAVKDYSLNSATGDTGGEPAQKSDTAQKSQDGPGARTR
jgi:hypothetical protein